MDQFDRSPEDVSFDLDAEEFSLESILDEYKDFQTDAPAPRPQPAYPRRPVKAEMVEEDADEDAEAEDILMSAELDSALKAADPEAAASAADTPRLMNRRMRITMSSAISRSASATTRPKKRSKSGTRRRPTPSVWPKKASRD